MQWSQVVNYVVNLQERVRYFPNAPRRITEILRGPNTLEINELEEWVDLNELIKKAVNISVRPADIDQILKQVNPSYEEKVKVKKWLKDRSLLILKEADQTLMPGGRPLNSLNSSDEVNQEAEAFRSWLVANPQTVAQINFLNLDHKELTSVPPEIGHFLELFVLDLSHNQLHSLPYEIFNLRHVTHLDGSHNCLTILPSELSNLRVLISLDVSENQLTSLPPEIGKGRFLRDLNLKQNLLDTLPKEFIELSTLNELDLRNNRFTSIPNEIRKPWPKKFLISGNPLSMGLRMTSSMKESSPMAKLAYFISGVSLASFAY